MTNSEKLAEIAKLLDKLYDKYPRYISFNCTLSNIENKNIISYNIYNPDIGHNNFIDYDELTKFINKLLVDGIKDVKTKILEEQLKRNIKNRDDAILIIKSTEKELNEIHNA